MVEKLYKNLNGNQIELNKYINCNTILYKLILEL